MFFRMGIRTRLTLLFVFLFGIGILIISSFLYGSLEEVQQREFDVALLNHTVDLGNALDFDLFGSLSLDTKSIYDQRQKVMPFLLEHSFLQIRRVDGSTIMKSPELGNADLPFTKSDFGELQEMGFGLRDIKGAQVGAKDRKENFRQINCLVKRPNYPVVVLQVAVPKTFLEAQRRGILNHLAVIVPLVIFSSAAGGLWFASRALRPVRQIIATAQQMDVGRLTERLPVARTDDEIKKLSITINDLLQRLQDAFESQERFVADASHQLKTPLAVLRGELDVLSSRPRTEGETNAFLLSARQEITSLSKTIEDLLLLARVDAGQRSLFISDVRIDELALSEIARLEKLAKAKSIRLVLDIEGFENADVPVVRGDRDLLEHLIYNLIENAIKYSPVNATVNLKVRNEPKIIEFSVRDRGPGVALEERSKVFQRFYRVQKDGKNEGVGLGLAISQKIAQLHGTTVEINGEPNDGSVFSIQIKKI